MSSWREYPEKPIVGVGGVVIEDGRALLIRRGNEPLLGQWSIPGGTLELGETLAEGTARELKEETSLEVKVLDLIEVFERINFGRGADETWSTVAEKKTPALSFRDCRLPVPAHFGRTASWRRCDRRCVGRGIRAGQIRADFDRNAHHPQSIFAGAIAEVSLQRTSTGRSCRARLLLGNVDVAV